MVFLIFYVFFHQNVCLYNFIFLLLCYLTKYFQFYLLILFLKNTYVNKINIGISYYKYYNSLLTSAIKKVNVASYKMIEAELNNEFPGGQSLIFDAKNDAVGIPEENPNLSDETVSKVSEVLEAIKSGQIEVKSEL